MDYQPMDYMFGRLQDETEQDFAQQQAPDPLPPPPEAPAPAVMQEAPAQQMTLEEQQAADNDRLRKQLAMVDERMKIMGLTGGGRRPIGMNELQKEGFRLRGEALQDVIPVAQREADVRAGLMKQSQAAGEKYLSDLQTLRDQQRAMFDARKVAMQQDEEAMRKAQDSFRGRSLLRGWSRRHAQGLRWPSRAERHPARGRQGRRARHHEPADAVQAHAGRPDGAP
jgi:hypothetical protein